MAKKRDKGDADASGDFGTEPGVGEPEFGSAEWLLAQLNGGRAPAESPRSPLLAPQQPVAEPAAEPAAAPLAEPVDAVLPPQQAVDAWRNPLTPPQQPVPTDATGDVPEQFDAVRAEPIGDAASAAVEPASAEPGSAESATGVEPLTDAWAAVPSPAAPLVPPAAQTFVPPAVATSLEELFGPPAAGEQADAAPFVPPAPPVFGGSAEADPADEPVVAPSAPSASTPVAPPVAAAPVAAVAPSDDNDFFAPPRSAQPDFFELALAAPSAEAKPADEPAPVAENEPVDESHSAEHTFEEPPATAVLPVFAPPPAAAEPELVEPVVTPLPAPVEQQPPILAAPQQPVAATPVAPAPDLSFTSAILTPVDEIEQLFGGQPEHDSDVDDAEPNETTTPAFSWGLTAGGDAAAAATAASETGSSDAEASLPVTAEPKAEQPSPDAPVFAEAFPAEAAFAEAPVAESVAAQDAEAVAEHAPDAPAAEAGQFAAEPIVAWADAVLTPPAQPDALDDAPDASLDGAHAEAAALASEAGSTTDVDAEAATEAAAEAAFDAPDDADADAYAPADTAAGVDTFAFAAPVAASEVLEPSEESGETPDVTSDDALADWFAASLAAVSTDESQLSASDETAQPSAADFDAMLAHDEDDVVSTAASAASVAPAAPLANVQQPNPFAETAAGPPPLIAPPVPSEAPLVVPAVAPAAASHAENSVAASLPQANTAGAATTPFGGLAPSASAGAPGSPVVPGSGSGAESGGGSKKPPRALVITLIAVAAVAVLVGLYFVGTQLSSWFGTTPAPVASSSPSEEPTAETPEPVVPTAMQPPGEHSWDALFGGECLDPFTSPWAETFTVVDCAAPHAAQLVYRGSFGGESSTLFPGEEALAGQINALCSVPGIVDLTVASAFGDLQVIGSYPVTAEQWESGQQNYYCFLTQVSGEPLTGSLAGPGPSV